jgi:hypothetical protein
LRTGGNIQPKAALVDLLVQHYARAMSTQDANVGNDAVLNDANAGGLDYYYTVFTVPVVMDCAAAMMISGVSRLRAPRSSSAPHRPQLFLVMVVISP